MHDSETPAIHQQVITATAFIHQKFDGTEKVLLAKRASTKKFLPNMHELPGGHIRFGEDIIQGLKREILEELHISITVSDPFFAFTYMNNIKESHSIEVVYFATCVNIHELRTNQDDHSSAQWLDEQAAIAILKNEREAGDPELAAVRKGFSLLNHTMIPVM